MANNARHQSLPADAATGQQHQPQQHPQEQPPIVAAPDNQPVGIDAEDLVSELLFPICHRLTADQAFLHRLTFSEAPDGPDRAIQQHLLQSAGSHYTALVQAVACLSHRFSTLSRESTTLTTELLDTRTKLYNTRNDLLDTRAELLDTRGEMQAAHEVMAHQQARITSLVDRLRVWEPEPRPGGPDGRGEQEAMMPRYGEVDVAEGEVVMEEEEEEGQYPRRESVHDGLPRYLGSGESSSASSWS